MIEEQTIDGEITALEVERNNALVTMRPDMTPSMLRHQIAEQKEMRDIMTEYVRSEMKENHHFYSFNKDGKPTLTKDGAYLICGLFKVIPGPVTHEIIREEGGHFTVVCESSLQNANGVQIATGTGTCTTRESKYAYRWVSESNVPKDIDKATLKTRSGNNQYGSGKYIQYQLPTQDLADLENTVLKMAAKRSTVAAVQKLPLVSELFATDLGESTTPSARTTNSTKSNGNRSSTKQEAKASRPAVPADDRTYIDRAINLAEKLSAKEIDMEDLVVQFLPEGVARFEELTNDQAEEIVPGMVELFNSKLAEGK